MPTDACCRPWDVSSFVDVDIRPSYRDSKCLIVSPINYRCEYCDGRRVPHKTPESRGDLRCHDAVIWIALDVGRRQAVDVTVRGLSRVFEACTSTYGAETRFCHEIRNCPRWSHPIRSSDPATVLLCCRPSARRPKQPIAARLDDFLSRSVPPTEASGGQ